MTVRLAGPGLAGVALLAGAHAVPSVASLGQWLPVREAPGAWCTWRGPRARTVALTFDDGPDPTTTGPILDRLADLDVPASFFVLGEAAARHPDQVREIVERGHSLGLHGHRHEHHLARSPWWIGRDLARAAEVVGRVTRRPVRWFRPPYGQISGGTALAARRLELRTVLWSAWGREWAASSPDEVVHRVLGGVEPGAIVLLHDSDATSPDGTADLVLDALEPLVVGLRSRGLGLVTLDDLLAP